MPYYLPFGEVNHVSMATESSSGSEVGRKGRTELNGLSIQIQIFQIL